MHVTREGQRSERSAARRSASRRRVIGLGVAVALVLAIAGIGAWVLTHRGSTDAAAAATSTQLVAATTDTVKETVSATGTIAPASQANLKFGQGGKVTSVGVKVGDTVKAGQALASIDSSSLQAAVTLAQQQLTAASAQLTAATAAANASQIASANAQVTSAQNKVTSAQDALNQATLTSTIDGTVATVNVAVGDTVTGGSSSSASSAGSGNSSSGSSSGSGGSAAAGGSSGASASSTSSAHVVVISTNAWVVNATVGASDLPKLKTGLQATITPTGASAPIFGTVSTVGVIGTTSGGTSTFPVTIAVTGSPTGVYAGTTANVVLTVRQISDVLTVPTAAIHDENGATVVYQMKDGAQVSTPVTVGAVYGTNTQITQGLSAGDQVVVTGRTGRTSTGTSTGGTGRGTGQNGFGQNGQSGGGFAPGGSGQNGAPPPAPGGN